MPAEFWKGEEFEHSHERLAQAEIIKSFRRSFDQSSDFVLLAFNFFFEANQIDLLILKADAIVLVDLKDCDKPIMATENGPWKLLTGGELLGNPFQQVGAYRYALMKYLSNRSSEFLLPQKASQADFEHISGVVAVSPSLHPDSKREIGRIYKWFHLVGVDTLHTYVTTLTSKRFAFTEKELRTLVERVLNCKQMPLPAEDLVDRLKQLPTVKELDQQKYFRNFIEPLYADAEDVARDYMTLFAELIRRLSAAEHADEVIGWLEERRSAYQPVRMKLRALLDHSSQYNVDDPTQKLIKGLWGVMKGGISLLEEGHGRTPEYGFGGHTVLDIMKRLQADEISPLNRARFIDHARGQQAAIERAWEDVVRSYAKLKAETFRA